MMQSLLRSLKDLLLSIDNSLFASYTDAMNKQQVIYSNTYSYPNHPFENHRIDKGVADHFNEANQWQLKEFIYHYQDRCTIDPLTGWAFTPSFQFINHSNYNRYLHRKKLRLPSYLKYRLYKKNTTRLKTVTPLFYAWNNYFHFYNDIIGAIHLARKLQIETTFLLPEEVKTEPYFHEYLEMAPSIASISFYFVKRNEYIQAETTFFINTFFAHHHNFDGVKQYIDWNLIAKRTSNYAENIYITRPRGNRGFANEEAVVQLMEKYQFKAVSFENASVSEQIYTLQHAKNIISIHGAALTNIIFATPYQTKLIELFSKPILNPCYWWMCLDNHIEYAALMCDVEMNSPTPFMRNIIVDIPLLEQCMKEFMHLPQV